MPFIDNIDSYITFFYTENAKQITGDKYIKKLVKS